ncbi:NAD(P)H-binding protein [Pedobacter xixiisoli]|uniref:Nucleoside-diphosphate-sugar epimerase n=1 Tax=Pedobacter xixiisoli TaxID=1476464 RepID=A0A286AE64_9SPHI|nr:NAD(P)H-binding protein [Pedobacter xixiisoli]SOD20190.1 Nucleoside-diphosphate-sugar epimerase [Pedobacter xixiisoli]
MDIKTISILGCGWFGLPFAKTLMEKGFKVKGSTTSADKLEQLRQEGIKPFPINLNETTDLPADFFDADLLFVNVPPRAKTESAVSYPDKLKSIADAAKGQVKQVIFISSTGVFEDGNFEVDENSQPNPESASGKALLDAENLWKAYPQFTTTIIRFAGLIGPNRNLSKFFAGKVDIPNGEAPINLITLQDGIELCLRLLETQQFGVVYHGVSPHHPTREAFYTELCRVSGMAKPVFKDELLDWKQINSVNVSEKLNYKFEVQNWFDWMKNSPIL